MKPYDDGEIKSAMRAAMESRADTALTEAAARFAELCAKLRPIVETCVNKAVA